MAAGDVTVTVVGNLTNDPELRFTPSGAAVASFTVASTPRFLDKNAEGIYAVVTLQAEPATVKELDRQLTLNESVLRTKVIRPDAR